MDQLALDWTFGENADPMKRRAGPMPATERDLSIEIVIALARKDTPRARQDLPGAAPSPGTDNKLLKFQ